MSTNFYEKYTRAPMTFIQEVNRVNALEKQPEFIHTILINGREVAFLGDPPTDSDQLLHKFVRIDRMVIPGYARLVKIEELLKQLPPIRSSLLPLSNPEIKFPRENYEDQEPEDDSCIDTSVQDLFYEGQSLCNVLLSTPGLITVGMETKRHFHNCHNYQLEDRIQKKGVTAFSVGSDGIGVENNCSGGHLASYFDGDTIKYKLQLFYIGKKDFPNLFRNELVKEIELGEIGFGPKHDIGTIQDNLSAYFEKEDIDDKFPMEKLDWKKIEGIFLMPMFFPDQRIVYLCLINQPGESNGGLTIKENLRRWCEAIACMNEDPENRELYIGANDLDFAGVDQMAVLVGKHAFPVVYDKSVLHWFIERSKVSLEKD